MLIFSISTWHDLASFAVKNLTFGTTEPASTPVASKFSWLLPQKPLKRRQTSKAPNPIRKEPPSKAISFGVCTIGMRAEPMRISPRNLKQIWSSNMSVDCSFSANDPSIYVSSWNKRNSLRLWLGCSTELNAFSGKTIGRPRDPFRTRSTLMHHCSIKTAMFQLN